MTKIVVTTNAGRGAKNRFTVKGLKAGKKEVLLKTNNPGQVETLVAAEIARYKALGLKLAVTRETDQGYGNGSYITKTEVF